MDATSSRSSRTTRSARSRFSRATRRSSGPARANRTTGRARRGAAASIARPTRGETWTYLGLHDTRSIGRVVLDPADPNVAYVAAVGNLWAANPERGVFKTTDAGRTWTKVLYVDHLHRRDRSRDGSARFEGPLRRDLSAAAQGVRLQRRRTRQRDLQDDRRRRDVDEARERHSDRRQGTHRAGDRACRSRTCSIATIEHATAGGTYRTEDAGATWKRMSATNPRPMYYSKPTIDPNNDKRIWLPGTYIVKSEDGGDDVRGRADVADLRRRPQDRSPRHPRRSRQLQPHLRRRRRRAARELRHGQDATSA